MIPKNLDRALAESADGAFVVGGDGRIVSWNRSAETILGYAARAVIGRLCCDVFVGRDARGDRLCYRGCHVRALIELGESVHNYDLHTATQTGDSVWLNVSVLSIPPLTVHLFRDITVQHELLGMVRSQLRALPPVSDDASLAETLTRREVEVLKLLGAGLSTSAIAQRLHVSPATIRNHMQHILAKLGVHSRLEAIAVAMQRGWL